MDRNALISCLIVFFYTKHGEDWLVQLLVAVVGGIVQIVVGNDATATAGLMPKRTETIR